MRQGAHLEDARVLQVGAGGVGAAIGMALLDAGVRDLVLYDPDEGRLGRLVDLLSRRGRVSPGPPDPMGFDVVCHATPLGLSPHDPLPLNVNLFRPSMFVGDVIAGEGTTPLLAAAQYAGCGTSDGVQMVEAVLEIMQDFLIGEEEDA